MSKLGNFRSLSEANKANALYQRAEEEWRRGRMRFAFRDMLAAAEAGMSAAFESVAQFYDFGRGTRVDRDAALYWYRRAHRRGDTSVQNNIGCIWRDRGQLTRALWWFRRAVELGDGDANMNIAKIYLYERHDLRKASQYLRRAARSAWTTEGTKEDAQNMLRRLKAGNLPQRARQRTRGQH